MRHALAARVLALFLLAPGIFAAEAKPLSPVDRAWLDRVTAAWSEIASKDFRLAAAPLPPMFLFDTTHAWKIEDGDSARATGVPHGGTIVLPDGDSVPAQVISFAATFGEPPTPWLVMSLPEVWKNTERMKGERDLDELLLAVFSHEMTHTVQSRHYGARIGELIERHQLGDEIDDDVLQDRFGAREGYRELYERERDLLFAVADATSAEARRTRIMEALDVRKTMRERFFSREDAFWGELGDIFLEMEGAGQWAGYRAMIRNGASPSEARERMRRGRKKWSQDEGLALYLALDAAVPGWQAEVFRDEPSSAWTLLGLSIACPPPLIIDH